MNNNMTACPWPLKKLAIFYLVSIILAALCLPGLDGTERNNARIGMYAILSIVFWVRVYIAMRNKESGSEYILYVIILIAGVFFISPLEQWLAGK